jgi:hypothetical protein
LNSGCKMRANNLNNQFFFSNQPENAELGT